LIDLDWCNGYCGQVIDEVTMLILATKSHQLPLLSNSEEHFLERQLELQERIMAAGPATVEGGRRPGTGSASGPPDTVNRHASKGVSLFPTKMQLPLVSCTDVGEI
jgi:hypothetical protein